MKIWLIILYMVRHRIIQLIYKKPSMTTGQYRIFFVIQMWYSKFLWFVPNKYSMNCSTRLASCYGIYSTSTIVLRIVSKLKFCIKLTCVIFYHYCTLYSLKLCCRCAFGSSSLIIWSGSRSRGQKWPPKIEKMLRNFTVWSATCFLVRAKVFYCSLDVLYGDIGISTVNYKFFYKKDVCKFLFFIFGHQTTDLELDQHWTITQDPDPQRDECGSATCFKGTVAWGAVV